MLICATFVIVIGMLINALKLLAQNLCETVLYGVQGCAQQAQQAQPSRSQSRHCRGA